MFLNYFSFQLYHKTKKSPITLPKVSFCHLILSSLLIPKSMETMTFQVTISMSKPILYKNTWLLGKGTHRGPGVTTQATFQEFSSDTTLQTGQVFSCHKEVWELVDALLFKFMNPKILFQSFLQPDKSADSRRQHAYVEDFRSCHFKEKNVFCCRHNPQPLF